MGQPKFERVEPDELKQRLAPTMRRLDRLDQQGFLAAPVDLEPMLDHDLVAEFAEINATRAELTEGRCVVVSGNVIVKHLDMRADLGRAQARRRRSEGAGWQWLRSIRVRPVGRASQLMLAGPRGGE